MAILELHFRSNVLWRTVPVQVILPIDKWENGHLVAPGKKFKTLYLLHGLHGDYTEWHSKTRLRRWAEANDLAVVMPSGDNSYYVDQPVAQANYGEFIGRELVELTRAMLPLSNRREDTYIGGLSMGGYGAMRNGLKYSDTFGAIISLSAALQNFEPHEMQYKAFKENLFGPFDQAVLSDNNPRLLAEKLADNPCKPAVFLACGLQDKLLPWSRLFRDLLSELGFEVHYEDWEGDHDWDFWDTAIEKAIRWLPLK